MATKNQIRAALRKKRKRGLLPPQTCPLCKADLADHDVPAEYATFAEMFSNAREIALSTREACWECPVCGHRWGKHDRLSSAPGR